MANFQDDVNTLFEIDYNSRKQLLWFRNQIELELQSHQEAILE